MLSQLLTTKEAAELLNVPSHKILRAIHKQILPAQKKGWFWIVNQEDLMAVKDKIVKTRCESDAAER